MAQPFAQIGRHPHCPVCDYDLVAAVDAAERGGGGRITCPECGEPLERHELRKPPRPEDWTLRRGLRRGTVGLTWRGLLVMPLWAGLLILIFALNLRGWLMCGAALALLLPGWGLGWWLGHALVEEFGIDGPLVALIGTSGLWVMLSLTAGLVVPLIGQATGTSIDTGSVAMATVITGALGSIYILMKTWISEL